MSINYSHLISVFLLHEHKLIKKKVFNWNEISNVSRFIIEDSTSSSFIKLYYRMFQHLEMGYENVHTFICSLAIMTTMKSYFFMIFYKFWSELNGYSHYSHWTLIERSLNASKQDFSETLKFMKNLKEFFHRYCIHSDTYGHT